jgi:hypothetical protein
MADSLWAMTGSPDRRDHADGEGEQADGTGPGEMSNGPPRSKPDRPERRRGRIQSSSSAPSTSDRLTKWAVDRLDERERRFSFAASAGAVLFGIVIYVVETNSHFHPKNGQLSPQTVLIVGLVGGALLFGATLLGRRAPVGFVALFTGLAFSNSTLFLALPFLALAIWILYRSFKIQRELAANARAARAESKGSVSRSSRSATSTSGSRTGSQRKARSGQPARPEANKRYTPKRPPPPAPKPSRRERKAAPTTD